MKVEDGFNSIAGAALGLLPGIRRVDTIRDHDLNFVISTYVSGRVVEPGVSRLSDSEIPLKLRGRRSE